MPGITSAATATPPSATRPARPRSPGYSYKRREVERGVLYRVVRDHVETFYQAVEDGFVSAALPSFVREEFERYVDCGVLCRGAALLVCEDCPEAKVIALSCKGRGFCPSCLGRRMAQTAANLVDHVLPETVPVLATFDDPALLNARMAHTATR